MNTSTSDDIKNRLSQLERKCAQRMFGYWAMVQFGQYQYCLCVEDMDEALTMEGVRRLPVRLTAP